MSSDQVFDLVAKSLLLGCVCLIGMCVLRRFSASARHVWLVAGMLCLVALPVLFFLLPRWQMPFLWEHRVTVQSGLQQGIGVATAGAPESPSALPITWPLIWALGAAFPMIRTFVGWCAVYRARRQTPRMANSVLLSQVESILGKGRVTVLESNADQPPMTWGWKNPVLMLPSCAHAWPEARIRSVVFHELAHIDRCDWLTHTLARLACAVYWFHPGVWLIARQMHVESERAADDRVIELGCEPEEYARHLVEVARTVHARKILPAVAMAHRSPIHDRLNSILSSRMSRRPLSKPAAFCSIGICAAIAVALAGAGPREVVVQQSAPERAADSPILAVSVVPTDTRTAQGVSWFETQPANPPEQMVVRTESRRVGNPARRSLVLLTPTGKPRNGQECVASMPALSKKEGKSFTTVASNSDEMKDVNKEISKALEEAGKEIGMATREMKSVDFPGVESFVPEIRVDTPAINLKKSGLSVHVPGIHIRIPKMHVSVPPTHVQIPALNIGDHDMDGRIEGAAAASGNENP